ncbi:transposase [Paenibacillus larvae]|uniref:transposase n=1 Tax=Paenibacillus larvae TaxID=1464 RepID=UPI00228044CF|nr:transposase [Paenibacillus larvae]MCY9525716.1 transposase [Paenibacillus larvae]
MRRTKYSNEFKVQVVKEALETRNKAAVARRYELASNMLHRWIKEYESGKWGVISVGGISPLETKKLSQENDHLKRLLVENIFFLFFVKKKYTNGQKLILL